jgi:hypothetical protein
MRFIAETEVDCQILPQAVIVLKIQIELIIVKVLIRRLQIDAIAGSAAQKLVCI